MIEIKRWVAKIKGRNCDKHFEGEYIDDPGEKRTGWAIRSLTPIQGGIDLSVFGGGICGIDALIQNATQSGENKKSAEITCTGCGLRKRVTIQRYEIVTV